MFEEMCIFTRHRCHGKVLRHLLERHPVVVQRDAFTFFQLLHRANDHQWCDVYGHETIQHDRHDSRAEEQGKCPADEFPDVTHIKNPPPRRGGCKSLNTYLLLECTVVSGINHSLAGIHVNFHTAVLCLTSSSSIVSNGVCLAITCGRTNLVAAYPE